MIGNEGIKNNISGGGLLLRYNVTVFMIRVLT